MLGALSYNSFEHGEARERKTSTSRKWIRRLTSSSASSSKPDLTDLQRRVDKKVRLSKEAPSTSSPPLQIEYQQQQRQIRRRSQTSMTNVTTTARAARPQISVPTPAKGFLSTRRPITPKTKPGSGSVKANARRPVTPKKSVTPKSIFVPPPPSKYNPYAPLRHSNLRPSSSRSRRPGSSRSTRSSRRTSVEVRSLQSTTTNETSGPAYISCLDDYMAGSRASADTLETLSHPHLMHNLADGFHYQEPWYDEENPEFPALPSATSWTLERPPEHLWEWKGGVVDRATGDYRTSQYSSSDSTLADDDETPTGTVMTIPKKVVMNPDEPSFTYIPNSTIISLPPTRPLDIVKPRLRLEAPPRGHIRRQDSTSSLFTPELSSSLSSTIASSSPTTVTSRVAEGDSSDVWGAVQALQASWEEGYDTLMDWIFGPRCFDSDDSEDESDGGLVSLGALLEREKRFEN
ncbi:hypothetical protein FRB97_005072 [Tulasnella sp. 331]|nr:hypothetical protein FRB97_005072 [Tulasnella sp. 331]